MSVWWEWPVSVLVGVACESVWWEWLVRVSGGSGL